MSEDCTVVMEVGHSETETQLTNDSRYWLEHPDSSVRISFIVKLRDNPDETIK